MLHWQQPVPHLTLPRHTSIQSPTPASTPGEDTPASPSASTQHREQQIRTGYKPSLDWPRAWRQGLLPTMGEILGSHWTAIARLKLGSPQPVR